MENVLIDASNLRAGGGVQVASSFLDELSTAKNNPDTLARYPWLTRIHVEATPEVAQNLSPITKNNLHISIKSRRPNQLGIWVTAARYDVVLVVFGPAYGRKRARREIVGFADVTSLFDTPDGLPKNYGKPMGYSTLRRAASKALFRRADRIIVEAEHVRAALKQKWNLKKPPIDVVPNCVNQAIPSPPPKKKFKQASNWCFVTRNYPHKNVKLLGQIGNELEKRSEGEIKFLLTLNDAEWNDLDYDTRRHSINVGPKTVHELSEVYSRAEGSVFPSLLECFSVTPLEALLTDTPLIASDRDFVREVCGDAAIYCDPYDPVPWADAIQAIRNDPTIRETLVKKGRKVTEASWTAENRAERYLEAINHELRALTADN